MVARPTGVVVAPDVGVAVALPPGKANTKTNPPTTKVMGKKRFIRDHLMDLVLSAGLPGVVMPEPCPGADRRPRHAYLCFSLSALTFDSSLLRRCRQPAILNFVRDRNVTPAGR